MNAKEHDAPKAKFNQDFDNFMSGLDNTDPLDSEFIQIDLEFLDLNDVQEFIDYHSLDIPDEFDDLDDWSDNVDRFMEGLLNPHMIEELWQKSKAKKKWDNFQSGLHNQQASKERIPRPATQRDNCATTQTQHKLDDVALRAKMGLPPPKPYYCTLNFPFRLQNITTVFREVTESNILTDSEKGLDSLLSIGQGQTSRDLVDPVTDQTKAELEEGNPINPPDYKTNPRGLNPTLSQL